MLSVHSRDEIPFFEAYAHNSMDWFEHNVDRHTNTETHKHTHTHTHTHKRKTENERLRNINVMLFFFASFSLLLNLIEIF